MGIISCKNTTHDVDQAPVAAVENRVLTRMELEEAMPNNLSANDSIAYAQNYIQRWVKSALLLRKAELNLTPQEKDVEKILRDYRASLLIHKYKQKLLLQKHTALISKAQIEEYYGQMSENFKLDENIIQGLFVKVPLNAPNLSGVKKWCRSETPDDYIKLEEYCFVNAQKFDNFLDKWVAVTEINQLMPQPLPSYPKFLDYNKYYETSDSTSLYIIRIQDFRKANEVAPLSYVEDKIKAILLNKKRIQFIQNLEEELYNEGLKQKVIKFY
ncbi:hypothetical protein [Saccharicrinis carchari]|nr:hypothetical protein [Saccharicrinis carchari]